MGKTEKPIVIWHGGCVDGFAALWACYRAFGEVEAVRGHYQASDDEIARLTRLIGGRDVYIVDLSYPLDVIQRWRGHARHITLLDHHVTALEDLAPIMADEGEVIDATKVRYSVVNEYDLTIVFDLDRSGCGIAWDHLLPDTRPWLIDYVEDRDLWRFQLDNSREINAFLKHQEQTFERWDCMADALSLDDAVLSGIAAKTVVDHYIEKAVSTARLVEIIGPEGVHIVPAVNALYWNTSEVCERLANTPMCLVRGMPVRESMKAHEALTTGEGLCQPGLFNSERTGHIAREPHMVDHPKFSVGWHVRSDGKFGYSLRSKGEEPFDVSAIAKMYGGGGHRAAAGFAVPNPIHEWPFGGEAGA